ncbi:MAG TPA: hypothetical protein VEX60_11830 [Pyrinomonadaceae bacterium]|nr:hypothetical protein [Pyrinomonadaceae bacterium]
MRRINFCYEIFLAVGSSTTVSAWSLWNISGGANFWTITAGVVATAAIIKPFLPLASDIERFSKLYTGYADLFYDLKILVDEINMSRGITAEHLDRFNAAEKRYKDLAIQDDLKPRRRLLKNCEGEVQLAFPNSYFWNPVEIPAIKGESHGQSFTRREAGNR